MIRAARIAVCGLATACLAQARAQEPATPLTDGFTHMGVTSCSTAGCHGDQVSGPGAGPVVGQNEYFRWRSSGEAGAHSRAYAVLLTPHGQRIARNLGLGKAEEAAVCLDCHADNVPFEQRSERFQISDGVACEACHGGAQNWLAFHRIGAGHAANIDAGLYPTEDPEARARLCLGCHLGSKTKNQFVTHQIMGAGHPRLKFELDLYTTIQQHHTIDEDYRARKVAAPGAQVWAIGQALALQRTIELLLDEDIGEKGAFPELAFFDCHACHQPISAGANDLTWRPNPGRALGPGALILNDANLIMMQAAARVIDPPLANRLEQESRNLHSGVQNSRSQYRNSAAAILTTSNELVLLMRATDFSDPSVVRAILGEILNETLAARYTNYAAAEQALFAVQRLTADLNINQTRASAAIAEASRHAQSPYAYHQDEFRRALREIAMALTL